MSRDTLPFVLEGYPRTWCTSCRCLTSQDGWSIDFSARMIGIYCSDCGEKKESLPLDDVPVDLYDEIVEMFG